MEKRKERCPKCNKLCSVDEKGYLMDYKGKDNYLGWNTYEFHHCKKEEITCKKH